MLNEGYRVNQDEPENKLDYLKYIRPLKYQILLLLVATLAVYFNSLGAPFYLDDHHSITENPTIYNFYNLFEHRNYQIMRFIGHLSFTSNYVLHQESVFGYHLVNIFIHFLVGLGVFFLTRELIKTPKLQLSESYHLYLPLVAALLFVLHPLHTQAITYIVQRHAALAALFYVFALYFYVYARNHSNKGFFVLTAISILLALLSKENTVTIPAAILLIEILFFQELDKKKILLWSAIGLASAVVLGLILYFVFGVSFATIDSYTHTHDTKHISRLEYFSTQMLVLWHYIKLYFLPLGLHLDYDYPLQSSLFDGKVLAALAGHIALIAGTIVLFKKQPLIIFGVIFYYLAHSVESGVIPLLDYVFEHRTYLPDVGLSILFGFALIKLLDSKLFMGMALIAVVIIAFSVLTINRNSQWNDPIAFYQNETKLSPNKERVWAELGKIYMQHKDFDKALKSFGVALNLGREGNTIKALPTTFLNTYLAFLYSQQFKKAIYFESIMPVDKMSPHDRGVYFYMRGNRLAKAKQNDEAIKSFKQAIENYPLNYNARANLGALLIETGKKAEGSDYIKQVLVEHPGHNQAILYAKKYQLK